jgi:hypothetical protein
MEDNWISVGDKLPEVGKEVICVTRKSKAIMIKSIELLPGMGEDYFKYNFSHWQPLPRPPKNNQP